MLRQDFQQSVRVNLQYRILCLVIHVTVIESKGRSDIRTYLDNLNNWFFERNDEPYIELRI